MPQEIELQLHLWPWSAGNPKRWPDYNDGETVDLVDGVASFPFYGSPVFSVSSQVRLFLPRRHEKFSPFGPLFNTQLGQYQLLEAPHGILTGMRSEDDPMGYILTESILGRGRIHLLCKGAKLRHSTTKRDKEKATELYATVLSWSQRFEVLLEASRKWNNENKIFWDEVIVHFLTGLDSANEPRMALIVKIAEDMSRNLSLVVQSARKILLRERKLISASRMAEMDTSCLRWLVRQPGKSFAEKSASHKQRLFGVIRRESYDTLENRVLKDFLNRCATESARYLDMEVGQNQWYTQSIRTKHVRGFRHLCNTLRRERHLEDVLPPPPGLRPNYVLQNDYRYRKIWRNYVRLLRREDEQDRLWDWQSRTWADVVRTMICLTIYKQSKVLTSSVLGTIKVTEILESTAHIMSEQYLGCRIKPGCEPGPFLIRTTDQSDTTGAILEMVHSDHAGKHPATQDLGILGGHLYLVLTPLDTNRTIIVVVWAVNTAGAMTHPSWDDIGRSAYDALKRQEILLGRKPKLPKLKGFIAASDLDTHDVDLIPGIDGGPHLVQVAADPRFWPDAMVGMELAIEDVLKENL